MGGWRRSGNGRRQQKQLNSEMSHTDLKTPHTLETILPAVCKKNVSTSFVPQQAENHTSPQVRVQVTMIQINRRH